MLLLGIYTDTSKVTGITQFTDSGSTNPTTTQITQWITEVEADADARGLGSYTITDQYVDVAREVGYPSKETVAWLTSIANNNYEVLDVTNLITLPFTPIISITSLYRRTSSLGATDVFEELTEGRESTDSFIILKKRTKSNQYLGYALYFFNNTPYDGPQRIKCTYSYGLNLSTSIIGEWCTLKVALKVLDAIIADSTPIGSSGYSDINMNITLNPEQRRKDIISRIKELEDMYFPSKKLGITLI